MELAWVLGILFLVITMVFIVIAVFLPEWVGIQGSKAKSIQDSHREGSETDLKSPSGPDQKEDSQKQ